jgi:hypothetical protein
VPRCVISRKMVVLEVYLARFIFASGESVCRSQAHPDQPPSFVSPTVVERTAAEAVGDFVRVVAGLVRETSRIPSR